MSLERRVDIAPAFDKRHADPTKNYGIHGCDLRMYLIGPRGTVQFVVYTNWMLPHVRAEQHARTKAGDVSDVALRRTYDPTGADVGFHSPAPMWEGQRETASKCEFVGGPCYYDGSSLAAEEMLTVLIAEGSDAVWALMEERYHEWTGADSSGYGVVA
jgi:hypothetical protein